MVTTEQCFSSLDRIQPQSKELSEASGNQLVHHLLCSRISCSCTVDLFSIIRYHWLWFLTRVLVLMARQFHSQKDKKQGESEPLQVQSRFKGSCSPRSYLDTGVGLGWEIARSSNCTHWDPPHALFCVWIGKCSKLALAPAVQGYSESLGEVEDTLCGWAKGLFGFNWCAWTKDSTVLGSCGKLMIILLLHALSWLLLQLSHTVWHNCVLAHSRPNFFICGTVFLMDSCNDLSSTKLATRNRLRSMKDHFFK